MTPRPCRPVHPSTPNRVAPAQPQRKPTPDEKCACNFRSLRMRARRNWLAGLREHGAAGFAAPPALPAGGCKHAPFAHATPGFGSLSPASRADADMLTGCALSSRRPLPTQLVAALGLKADPKPDRRPAGSPVAAGAEPPRVWDVSNLRRLGDSEVLYSPLSLVLASLPRPCPRVPSVLRPPPLKSAAPQLCRLSWRTV